jgi:hypothetical protein
MFMGSQCLAQTGEGRRGHPPASIDATSSPERKSRDRAGIWQVHIVVTGGKFDHEKAFDERTQERTRNLLKNAHCAASCRSAKPRGVGRAASFLDQKRQTLIRHSRPYFDDFVIGEIVLPEWIIGQYGIELAPFDGGDENEPAGPERCRPDIRKVPAA